MSITSTDPALPAARQGPFTPGILVVAGLVAVIALALGVLYWDGLLFMAHKWESSEYNHGYMIPLVAVYLLWLRFNDLQAAPLQGSWLGIGLLLLSLAVLMLGELSAVITITQYAFVLSVWAIVFAAAGRHGVRLLWVPLLYLIFMVPLPNFLETRLTAGLQLLSSQIGVAVIRAAGYSVFLNGNVIDLGSFKLQVAEACSGMRYLFPLLSFGYLCAVLFRGRWWQRAILLLSTIPITIFMNSFRIGMIGILVNRYGIEQAEGFLHDFEGWVVFMASVGVLFFEVWIFARLEKRPFLEIFGLDIPRFGDLGDVLNRLRPNRQVLAGVAVLVVAAGLSQAVARPPTLIPDRPRLATFPMRVGEFQGRESAVDNIYIEALQVSDHLMASFARPADPMPVQMWLAYYDSQVKGASVHSPQACLPGGGWQIDSFEQREIPDVFPDGSALRVNRVEIAMGEERQLVYYWFAQRGRNIASEFMVKWYIFRDGLTMNRTDGALVRLTTYVGDKAMIPEAEARLQDFIRAADPKFSYYLPGRNVSLRNATPEEIAALETKGDLLPDPEG